MAEMQKIIEAENSDLFDVLAHVAYALVPLTREERALNAKAEISTHFNTKQQAFLDFVLSQYVKVGVGSWIKRNFHRSSSSDTMTPSPTRWPIWVVRKKSARSFRDSRSTSINKLPNRSPACHHLDDRRDKFCA